MTLSTEAYPLSQPEAGSLSNPTPLLRCTDSTTGEVEEAIAQLSGFLGSLRGSPHTREYLLKLAERFQEVPLKTNHHTLDKSEIPGQLNRLKDALPQYRQGLNSNASSAMFLGHFHQLSSLAQTHLNEIAEAKPEEVLDEKLSAWKNDVDNLENAVLTDLLSEMSTCVSDLEHDRKLLKDNQDEIERKVEVVRNTLDDKLKQIAEVRMKRAFFDDASQFQGLLKQAIETMLEAEKVFGVMRGQEKARDEANFEKMKSAFHTLQDSLLSYETRLEAIFEHRDSLLGKLPETSGEVSEYMDDVESSWRSFVNFCHDQEACLKSIEHWLYLHTYLDEIAQQSSRAEEKIGLTPTLSLVDLPRAIQETEDLLAQSLLLFEQMDDIGIQAAEDEPNHEAFVSRKSSLFDHLSELRSTHDAGKSKTIQDAFDKDVENIRLTIASEKEKIQQRRQTLGEQFIPDSELGSLKTLIKNGHGSLSGSVDVLGQLQQEWSSVQEIMQEISNISPDDIPSTDIDSILESLDSAIGAENQQLHIYEGIVAHIQAATGIEATTNELIADILEIRVEVGQDFLASIERKSEEIEKRASDLRGFNDLTASTLKEVQETKEEGTLSSDEVSAFSGAISSLQEKTNKEWDAMTTFLSNKKHIMAEYRSALTALDMAKAKLSKMGNPEEIGRIIDPEQELATTETDIEANIKPAIDSVSQMLMDFADIDPSMEPSRHTLYKKLEELNQLVRSKRQQVGRAQEFHALADEVDKLMGKMLEIYDATHDESFSYDAALHHLETNFIALAPDIVKTIEKAHAIAMELDDWRVIARWNVLPEQWEELRSLLSKRKKELLEAYKKASVSTRRRASQSTPSRSTTPHSRSGTPSRSLSRISTPGGRFSRLRISPKELPVSPNSYTFNPKDQLDSEIGRIVNNCPLRVKISKANDPNKYWIGETLCYCRILASKMVMVRVGGGWCELSRYLLDHNTELNSDVIELGGERINLNLNLKTPKQRRAVSWSVNTSPSATTTPTPTAGRHTPSRQTPSRQGRITPGRLTPGQQVSPNSLHKLTVGRKVEGSKSPSPRKIVSLNKS
ncbi:hypothetical protein K493DRAFT_47525 [Basidiobolus meristosporus CBS 931.73]|uniref:GAR domain-containing protein n=1 Tax=Basidiobolus meristosporus CBS 931.73 TaxID=1314790 RepID=A0A1Y1Y1Q4_9FUNG|nr:hypothetical protein K493DRAFT_47525 [Basidiobolus meristosporus CBS 931.73]|eukprot:ORX91937.1 hypothetical protein K493DRAFT_47525 [Basidiobolus meristosporus CBS 931.73]